MCFRCVEKRGDLSHYQEKVLPFRYYHLLGRKDWHDTCDMAMCECGCSIFCAAINESNMSNGGKWIMQCSDCKSIHVLPFVDWDAVDAPRVIRGVEGQS